MSKTVFFLIVVGALLYVIFPRDLIPDFLLGWGWIDDLVVLYMLWRYYRRLKLARPADTYSGRPRSETHDDEQPGTNGSGKQANGDPYSTLGIPKDATREEIKAAYRELAAKYHPDKVQHLGREFRELAEKRFKEIQQAYEILISK